MRLLGKVKSFHDDTQNSHHEQQDLLSLLQDEIELMQKQQSTNGQPPGHLNIDRGHLFKRLKINLAKFIRTSGQNIKKHYEFKECVGEGSYGKVFRAICKHNKEERAIKVLKNGQDKAGFLAEFALLSELDHPNIVKLYEIYYFKAHYYVVMEYCKGGSFIDLLKRNKNFSEHAVACIMRQLLSAVAYLHKQNIVHRDIKLDNIVVAHDPQKKAEQEYFIKLIDFGTAVRVNARNPKIAGTRNYMAPECFKGLLNVKSDVWSSGVFMYVFVTGTFPFMGSTFAEMKQQVSTKVVLFTGPEWRLLSQSAKKLMLGLLERNPDKRISAVDALAHPWFQQNHDSAAKITYEQCNLSMLEKYHHGNNFIAVIQQYLSMQQISQVDRDKLGLLFRQIDTNNDGVIEHAELVNICQEHFGVQTENEVAKILQEIDNNGSGQIDFNQFIVAMYSRERLFMQESLIKAFNFYDLDHDGYLEKNQLISLLEGCDGEEVEYLLDEVDTNGDNKVSLKEFLDYVNRGCS